MALVDEKDLPAKAYAADEVTDLGPLDARAKSTAIVVNRCTTLTPDVWADPFTYIEVELLISTDNGQTWESRGGWGMHGGVSHYRRDGSEEPYTALRREHPVKACIGRLHWRIRQAPETPGPKEWALILAYLEENPDTSPKATLRFETDEWTAVSVDTEGAVKMFDA